MAKHPTEWDAAGNCTTCGEAGRCPNAAPANNAGIEGATFVRSTWTGDKERRLDFWVTRSDHTVNGNAITFHFTGGVHGGHAVFEPLENQIAWTRAEAHWTGYVSNNAPEKLELERTMRILEHGLRGLPTGGKRLHMRRD